MGPGHLSALDWLVALILAECLIMPLATLAHELGHAALALRVAPGTVTVHVGRPSAAFGLLFRRLKIYWSPVPARGVQFRGICIWNGALAGPRAYLAVALSGPLVTALLIPIFVWAAVECANMQAWVPATWGLSALGATISLLYNLDPRPANDAERVAPFKARRDGPKALAAYRAWRREA